MEQQKALGLAATGITVLLCGLPGLICCVLGTVAISGTPIPQTINGQEIVAPIAPWIGITTLCFASIGLLLPVVVGFITLRNRADDFAINDVGYDDYYDNNIPPAV